MKRTFSTGLAVLVAIAGVVLGSASPAAASVVFNERVPIAGSTITDCAGETVQLTSGSEHILVTQTTDAHGGEHMVIQVTIGGVRGTSSSGVEYILNDAFTVNNQLNFTKGAAFETTVVGHIVLVPPGNATADTLRVLNLTHITVDANGNLASVKIEFTRECG